MTHSKNVIYHYGIPGMRWGVRRFQNPDGSLTPKGRQRYLNSDGSKKTDNTGYIQSRKKLYLSKRKKELKTAKISGNKAAQIDARNEYKFAKSIQKKGSLSNYVASVKRDVMGNMSRDERILFEDRERKNARNQRIINKSLKFLGPVVVSLVAAGAISQGKSYVNTGQFGKMSFKMINGIPTIVSTVVK